MRLTFNMFVSKFAWLVLIYLRQNKPLILHDSPYLPPVAKWGFGNPLSMKGRKTIPTGAPHLLLAKSILFTDKKNVRFVEHVFSFVSGNN